MPVLRAGTREGEPGRLPKRRLHLMSRFSLATLIAAVASAALTGCGATSSTPSLTATPTSTSTTATSDPPKADTPLPKAHPQTVQPTAGVQAASAGGSGAEIVGDVNAHAPSLARVKRELHQLDLCGGAITPDEAAPIVRSTGPGFTPDPGTSQTEGQLPVLTARLNELGQALGVTIYGISGYRTPAHSVAVGGYASDPHTKGEAEDIGVNSLLRSSAAQISEAELARFGLYRPFDPSDDPNNSEVNHIQLIPSGGPLSLTRSTATFDPDPTCQ
jgi:Peptidase M15